jgi:hypothetical protein
MRSKLRLQKGALFKNVSLAAPLRSGKTPYHMVGERAIVTPNAAALRTRPAQPFHEVA